MDVDVFLEDWQIECCTPPPGEGDRVDWPLQWIDDAAGPGVLAVAWTARPTPDFDQGLLLEFGSVTAWWCGSRQDLPARGRLLADLHGGVPDAMPRTAGTVTGVHVVEQAFRQTEPRTWERMPGDVELRRVSRSPERFLHVVDGDADPGSAEVARWEDGVLVRLRLADGAH